MRQPLVLVSALEDIQVAAPCTADWNEMTGNDRVRFCSECQKSVYNLSAMTSEQALNLMREKEARFASASIGGTMGRC